MRQPPLKKAIFSLLLILSLTLAGCDTGPGGGCRASWMPPDLGGKFLGERAPNFVLSNLSGEEVDLASLVSRKPTLLVFWATWCPTCVEEIPILNAWTEKFHELQILAIDVQETPQRVRSFAQRNGIRYPVLLDLDAQVAQEYGLVGIPAAILLAKGGKVIYYGFGLPENIQQLID